MVQTLTFTGGIDDSLSQGIHAVYFNSPQPVKTLVLNISSSGGSVLSAITAYNLLKSLPCEVHTHNLGEVSSAAVLPYLAGTVRTAEEISKFFIHPLDLNFTGSLPFFRVQEALSNLEQDINSYAGIVTREAPIIAERYDVTELLKHESLVLSPRDAFSLGLITHV